MEPATPAGDMTATVEVTTPAPDSSGMDAGSSPRLTDSEAVGDVAVGVGVGVGDDVVGVGVGVGETDGFGDVDFLGVVGFTDALGDVFVLGFTTTAG
jgi:hypothetical protein